MAQVITFPQSPSAIRAAAEEYVRTEMRMQLAAACGILQSPAGPAEINEVIQRMTAVGELIDNLLAIWRACE